MSKTPLTDAKECRRPLYSRGEWDGVPVADYVPSAVSRELETDRAELVEALQTVIAIMCDKEICGHFLPREIREVAEPLLARPEADK